MTLPDSATNRHGQGDIYLSWEEGAAAAANHEWSQNDWEENVGAADDNFYNYMEARNAAAQNGDHGDAHSWDNADWNAGEDEEWENQGQDLPLLHPDRGNRNKWPLSIHSSLPLLESVPPTPSPSPSPLPLQLQYIPHGEAGLTYALQVGSSLQLQTVEQRLALLHQLRNFLILEGQEENILSRRTSPAAATAFAAAVFGNTGRRRSAPTVLGFSACRRRRSV
jgi:hypothetical protein